MKTEVSALSPRVAFLDHQRLILNVDNSALKQRIAALAQDKIFKDGIMLFFFLFQIFSLHLSYICYGERLFFRCKCEIYIIRGSELTRHKSYPRILDLHMLMLMSRL